MARTWTNAILDEAKMQGDPPADDLVKSLFDQNEVEELNKVFYHLTRKDQSGFDRLPDSVQRFITDQNTLRE